MLRDCKEIHTQKVYEARHLEYMATHSANQKAKEKFKSNFFLEYCRRMSNGICEEKES